MRFIKLALLGAIVLMFLPAPPNTQDTPASIADGFVETRAVVSAASQTFADVNGFCARQPLACETAGALLTRLEVRAKYAIQLLYEWASEAQSHGVLAAPSVAPASLTVPGSPSTAVRSNTSNQNTLRIDDIVPDWRGPSFPENS